MIFDKFLEEYGLIVVIILSAITIMLVKRGIKKWKQKKEQQNQKNKSQ